MVSQPYNPHHCYCSRARLFFLLLRIAVYAVVFVVLFFIWTFFRFDLFFLAAIGAIFFLLLLRAVVQKRYSCFCVSDTELLVSCGMFFKSTDHVPFSGILRVQMHQSFFDRMLGVAHLHIYPKKRNFSESSFSYACLSGHGSYICVLPVSQALHLFEKLQSHIPLMHT